MPSHTDIMEGLVRLGLMSPGDQPLLTELTGGISSEIYKIDLALGSVCVKRALPTLKSDPNWHVPVSRSSAEYEWLQVAQKISPGMAPDPIGFDAKANIVVMVYLDPGKNPNWKEQLRDGNIDPTFAALTAERLAALHNATAGLPDIAKTFDNDEIFYDIRLEAYFVAAGRAVPVVQDILTEIVHETAEAKEALVHGDVSPKNILVGDAGPVFLDAECAWYGEPAFDAAFCLTHLLLKAIWKPQWHDGYEACHTAFRETYLGSAAWIDAKELDRRVTRLHLAMLLARVAGRSKVEYITDPEMQKRITSFTCRHRLGGISRTEDVAALWLQEFADADN